MAGYLGVYRQLDGDHSAAKTRTRPPVRLTKPDLARGRVSSLPRLQVHRTLGKRPHATDPHGVQTGSGAPPPVQMGAIWRVEPWDVLCSRPGLRTPPSASGTRGFGTRRNTRISNTPAVFWFLLSPAGEKHPLVWGLRPSPPPHRGPGQVPLFLRLPPRPPAPPSASSISRHRCLSPVRCPGKRLATRQL